MNCRMFSRLRKRRITEIGKEGLSKIEKKDYVRQEGW